MRILIAVGQGGINSGGSFQAANALAGLKNAGHEVLAVWGSNVGQNPPGFHRLKRHDIPLHTIPIDSRATWGSISRFRTILKEFQPDVVECFKGGAQHHVLYASVGLKHHAIIFYRGVSNPLDMFQALKYRLPRVDRIIANCRELKEIMVKSGHINPDKIDAVHGEFDPACANPCDVDVTGLRRELDIPNDIPLVTQLGNYSIWRGQKITIEAASKLRQQGLRFHILFVGGGTNQLSEAVKRYHIDDIVTISPFRGDPERILKISDIFVMASTSTESLSGSLINAQAMGIPAVASSVTGSVEVVEDGKTGFIITPNDVDALANGMVRMLNMKPESRLKMGQAARLRACALFSPEVRVKKRLECYRRAIEHRRERT